MATGSALLSDSVGPSTKSSQLRYPTPPSSKPGKQSPLKSTVNSSCLQCSHERSDDWHRITLILKKTWWFSGRSCSYMHLFYGLSRFMDVYWLIISSESITLTEFQNMCIIYILYNYFKVTTSLIFYLFHFQWFFVCFCAAVTSHFWPPGNNKVSSYFISFSFNIHLLTLTRIWISLDTLSWKTSLLRPDKDLHCTETSRTLRRWHADLFWPRGSRFIPDNLWMFLSTASFPPFFSYLQLFGNLITFSAWRRHFTAPPWRNVTSLFNLFHAAVVRWMKPLWDTMITGWAGDNSMHWTGLQLWSCEGIRHDCWISNAGPQWITFRQGQGSSPLWYRDWILSISRMPFLKPNRPFLIFLKPERPDF